MNKLDRLADLLAANVKPSVCAAILGFSQSYISQLMQDPDFSEAINELRVQKAAEAADEIAERRIYTDRLAGAEHSILDKILAQVEGGVYTDERFLLQALNVVGARRDAMEKATLMKTINPAGASGGSVQITTITIPAICLPEMRISATSEILSIGNQDMTPMPAATLQKMIKAENEREVIDHDS